MHQHGHAAETLIVERVGPGDLIAIELGAILGGEVGDAEALERLAGQVDAAVGEVLVDVTQDICPLHGVAERAGGAPGALVPDAQDGGHQLADAARHAVAVDVEVALGLNVGCREVIAHALQEGDERRPWQPVAGREVGEDDGLARRGLVGDEPRLDCGNGGGGLGTLLVDEVVEGTQHEVQQDDVVADRRG